MKVFISSLITGFGAQREAAKRAVLAQVARVLAPGGVLFLGGAETTYGLEVPQDASSAPPAVEPLPNPPPATDEPMTTAAFDQLMASLSCLPDQASSSVSPPASAPDSDMVGAEQFDTWMSFLDTFTVNFDETSAQDVTPAGTPTSDLAVTNMLDTGMGDVGPSLEAMGVFTNEESSSSAFDAMLTSIFKHQLPCGAETEFSDNVIDPALLALSGTSSTATTAHAGSVPDAIHYQQNIPELGRLHIPMTAATPTASGSSASGSTTPGTPVSAPWELSMPTVYMDAPVQGQTQGTWRTTTLGF